MSYAIIGCIGGTVIYTTLIVQGVNYAERTTGEANNCCGGGPGESWWDLSGCCASPK